eukprot:g77572.t1
MFNGRQPRERDRVGPAVEEHYRQMGREFLQTLGLPENTNWRQLAEQNIPIPQAVGRQLVERLMSGREDSQAARGRNTWNSAATARAMDRINPVTEARPDWRPAFHQLSRKLPKLRLEHNPDVEPMLDDVYGLPRERAVASARAARRSQASPLRSTSLSPAQSAPALVRSSANSSASPLRSTSLSPAQSAPALVRSSANSSSPPPPLRDESASLPLRTASLPLRSASLPAPFVSSSVPSAVVVKREGHLRVHKAWPEYKEVRAPADRQALLLCCNNSFHRKCIGDWWQRQHEQDVDTTCPLCKGPGCSYMTSYKYGHHKVHWGPREYTAIASDDSETDLSAEIDRAWHRISKYAEGSFRARVKREPRQVDGSIRVKPELGEAEGKSESSAAALIRQQDDEYVTALAEDLLSGKVSGGGGQSLEEQQLIAAIQQSLKEAKAEAQSSQEQESIPVPTSTPVPQPEDKRAKAKRMADSYEHLLTKKLKPEAKPRQGEVAATAMSTSSEAVNPLLCGKVPALAMLTSSDAGEVAATATSMSLEAGQGEVAAAISMSIPSDAGPLAFFQHMMSKPERMAFLKKYMKQKFVKFASRYCTILF